MISNRVYIIDDDQRVRDSFSQTLSLENFQVQAFNSANQFLQQTNIDSELKGVIIADIKMPEMSGLELLDCLQQTDSDIPVILITGHGDIDIAIDGMKRGAYDFIEKPFKPDRAIDSIIKAQRQRALILENRQLRQQLNLHCLDNTLIGSHPLTEILRKQIQNLSQTNADVLIYGETGTGKELVARALHNNSNRQKGNFVALNCSAIPEQLIESELFGFEPGAFTDARKQRIGKIEHANHGTLFLDEIETIPMNVQIKLLRVLQERTIERLGSNHLIELDFTILAATKSDLQQLSNNGDFRADLYYRLDVANIQLPPLRLRGDDILLLFQYFTDKAAHKYQRQVRAMGELQKQQLLDYNWPGNIRECQNLAEKWVLGIAENRIFNEPEITQDKLAFDDQMADFEKKLLLTTLHQNQWKISQSADQLQIPRKKLYLHMKKHNIEKQNNS